MGWTVSENRELSMCEKPQTRKYTSLKPLASKALSKYMLAVKEVVQARIKEQLRLLIDAWTEDVTHFVAAIAVTSSAEFLMSFSTLEDEADMGADSMIQLLDDMLDT
ncbi:hypothetical protein P43SY_008616 [Pythium insidiosum]|uniref:Uncharacterized protein n=1 Tax=Pythium insidiosum TaxID=114742 RepID=A0AAD5MAN3_PYTIN|nr:hypothetical protein P43SY_008616 [Pythium insidiosum]